MLLIPVIDLKCGRAVHARLGRRDGYQPLSSPLCEHGEVLPLVERLVAGFGCSRLYLADLDAIQRRGNHFALLAEIAARHPGLELWIDAGFTAPADIEGLSGRLTFRPVIGSESWLSRDALPAVANGWVLSLDYDRSGLRDPSDIAADAARRPRDLILMDLSRVGSGRGPDLDRLRQWRRRSPASRLYAAGGVRDPADLRQLQSSGAAGVLLSSALHAGALSASDLSGLS